MITSLFPRAPTYNAAGQEQHGAPIAGSPGRALGADGAALDAPSRARRDEYRASYSTIEDLLRDGCITVIAWQSLFGCEGQFRACTPCADGVRERRRGRLGRHMVRFVTIFLTPSIGS